jgi:AcrR family transcriptional regulator
MAKQTRGMQTMERVLDAALVCFGADGLYAATIEDVAARSKVSIGSIYHHFGSRERIAFVLYCRSMESLLGAVAGSLGRQHTARGGVRAIVRSYLRWVQAHREEARFIYAAGQTDLLTKWSDELNISKQKLVQPVLAWFQPLIERGAVAALPPALYEIMVIGPPAEFARRWLSDVPGLDMFVALKVLPDAVWRSVAPSS